MQVTKRDGRKVEFDSDKIVKAITKAFIEVYPEALTAEMQDFAHRVADEIGAKGDMSVEEIQDIIVKKLMASKWKDVAQAYVEYRYLRKLVRQGNTTDKDIEELLDGTNEYLNGENSNKNAKLVHCQRDYMAGTTSTDISRRLLLPKDVVAAHDAGIIHFHDMDYFAQKSLHNCELINLEDMLQNGTVISGTMIEKPHSFYTACNIVSSQQQLSPRKSLQLLPAHHMVAQPSILATLHHLSLTAMSVMLRNTAPEVLRKARRMNGRTLISKRKLRTLFRHSIIRSIV